MPRSRRSTIRIRWSLLTRTTRPGHGTELPYVKTPSTPGCSLDLNQCTWADDQNEYSIDGHGLTHSSKLGRQNYTYDEAGGLTQAQDTPSTNVGCTVRAYAFDANSNRSSLTSRAPGSGGVCASSGGTSTNSFYDEAERVMTGVTGADYSYDAGTVHAVREARPALRDATPPGHRARK